MESIEEVEEEKMTAEEEETVNDTESSGRNAQEELANLASSLMAAAAAQAQEGDGEEGEEGEENSNNSDAVSTLMMMKPLVKKARKLLFRRLRVGVEDSRVFIGKFHCLDKQGNLILYDTVEYRQISPPPSTTTTTTTTSSSSDDDGKQSCSFTAATTEGPTTEQRSLGLVLIPARCRTSCHVECSLEDQFSLLSV